MSTTRKTQRKKHYTVIIERDYFPGVYFSSEKEAIAWCDKFNYNEEDVVVYVSHALYITQKKRTRYAY